MRLKRRVFAYLQCNVFPRAVLACCLIALLSAAAHGQRRELITDGGFEGGGFGWQPTHDQVNTSNPPGVGAAPTTRGWFLSNVGNPTPFNGLATSAAGGGDGLYIVNDVLAPGGTMAVYQQFTVPTDMPIYSLLLSFDMFVNDQTSQTLFNVNQNARVDITTTAVTTGLPVANPPYAAADTGVIYNAYIGTEGGPLPNEFRHYEFDVTPYLVPGSTYRLRFNATSRVGVLNMGIDNVSLIAVPEAAAGTLGMGAMAMLAFAGAWRRRFT